MKKNKTAKYIPVDWYEYKSRAAYKMIVGDYRRLVKAAFRVYLLHAKDEFLESDETLTYYALYSDRLERFINDVQPYTGKRLTRRQAADVLNIDSVEV